MFTGRREERSTGGVEGGGGVGTLEKFMVISNMFGK